MEISPVTGIRAAASMARDHDDGVVLGLRVRPAEVEHEQVIGLGDRDHVGHRAEGARPDRSPPTSRTHLATPDRAAARRTAGSTIGRSAWAMSPVGRDHADALLGQELARRARAEVRLDHVEIDQRHRHAGPREPQARRGARSRSSRSRSAPQRWSPGCVNTGSPRPVLYVKTFTQSRKPRHLRRRLLLRPTARRSHAGS